MSEELNLDGMLSRKRPIVRFKIKEGSAVFRILPPFGENHNNLPGRVIQLHWGFQTTAGERKPIPCSYEYEKFCPICDWTRKLKEQAEEAKKNGDIATADSLFEKMREFGVRRSVMYNAANLNGEVGILDIPKSLSDELVKLMKSYQNNYNMNPTSLLSGVWFKFTRVGTGFKDTKYDVDFAKKHTLQNGMPCEILDNSALPANVIENYEKLAYDIHKLYKPVKAVDLSRILNGEPLEEVLGYKKDEKSSETQQQKSTEQTPKESSVLKQALPTQQVQTLVQQKVVASPVSSDIPFDLDKELADLDAMIKE